MSNNQQQQILFYTQKWSDKLWVVYWLGKETRLGIACFPDTVYELADVDMATRREFLNGLARTLVEEEWSTLFDEGSPKIKQVTDESATLGYAAKNFLELPRVDDPDARRKRIEGLVQFFIDEALEKKRIMENRPSSSSNHSSTSSPAKKSPIKRRMPRNSRSSLRKLPTLGVNLDDVIEEDQQRLHRVLPADTGDL